MSRPRPRLGADLDGLAELHAALVARHTDPHRPVTSPAFAEPLAAELGPPGARRSGGTVVPLRPDVVTEDAVPAYDESMTEIALPAYAGHDAGYDVTAADVDPEPESGADEPVPFEATAAGADVVALVQRAQAGDPYAFGELYDRYVDLVYRYIYYRVGSTTLAEDLVSETFLRALRRISSFEWQGRDFAAWLVTIARNLVADHFKSSRYRLEISTADMLDADRATDGPEAHVLDGITNAALVAALKRLNPEQQECLVLRFLQGLSVTETAQAMGKTEGAIKALQFRAVRSLGRLLPKELVL